MTIYPAHAGTVPRRRWLLLLKLGCGDRVLWLFLVIRLLRRRSAFRRERLRTVLLLLWTALPVLFLGHTLRGLLVLLV